MVKRVAPAELVQFVEVVVWELTNTTVIEQLYQCEPEDSTIQSVDLLKM